MILRLNSQQLRFLREETHRVYPTEACALLFGKMTHGRAFLERVITTPNVLKSSVRFEIDLKTFHEAFMQAETGGLEFIGFFHSHPAPAYPSSLDLEFMRLWGDAVWLIMNPTDNTLGAFQMSDGKVKRVTLKTDKP